MDRTIINNKIGYERFIINMAYCYNCFMALNGVLVQHKYEKKNNKKTYQRVLLLPHSYYT